MHGSRFSVHAEFWMSQMGKVYDLTKIGPKLSSVTFIFENAVQGELFLAYPILFEKLLWCVDLVVSDHMKHVREGFLRS